LQKANILDPAQVFDLFFTSEVIDLLVRHTNAYAEVKDANSGDKAWELPGCIWKEVSAIELKQWIGMLIYMGVFSSRLLAKKHTLACPPVMRLYEPNTLPANPPLFSHFRPFSNA